MTFHKTSKPKRAMILSAGFGSRLKPLTETTPKALVKVGGKPMLERNLDIIKNLGIKEVVINTHYLAEQISEFAKNYRGVDIELIHESEILETGGGILNAMREVSNEPMLIVNCDIVLHSQTTANPLSPLMDKWNEDKMDILAFLESNKPKYNKANGDFNLSETGKLLNEGKFKKYIFMGAYIVSPKFFRGYEVHKFRVPDILFKAKAEEHKHYGIENKSLWLDIGTPESLNAANEFFKNNETKIA